MFGKLRANRSFMTNKYKEKFKKYLCTVRAKDSDVFFKYVDAVMLMEKNMLIKEKRGV